MNKQALSLAVCIAGAYPLNSGAIGLGDIRSSSHLNQPLNAKIELLSISNKEAQDIKVRLASAEVFNRVGIDRPAYLNSLKFSSSIQNGKPVIIVSSQQPIKEPFLNFLLEVSWPQGQLLKEYTVQLDTPILMQSGNSLNNTASVRAEPKATGFVQRVPKNNTNNTIIPTAAAVVTAPENSVKLSIPPSLDKSVNRDVKTAALKTQAKYRVKSGDTLYKVAARVKNSGMSTDQMMLALFRANPSAFRNNNINGLKAGVSLGVPNKQTVQAISGRQAQQAVRKHYTEWKQFRKKLAGQTVAQPSLSTPPDSVIKKITKTSDTNVTSVATAAEDKVTAHLEVLGKSTQSTVNENATASSSSKAQISALEQQLLLAQESLLSKKRENTELKSRVNDLQSLISKKDRLITLKNQQLAKLQENLPNSDQEARSNQVENTAETANIPSNINANNETPDVNAAETLLTAAQIAEKRRESNQSIQSDGNTEQFNSDNGGFKDNPSSITAFLSSPIAAAAGTGVILLLLLAWLLIARRQEKAINDNDLMESLDNFDESFESLDNDIKQDDNLDTKGHQDFFSNIDNATEKSDVSSTRSTTKTSLTIDNAIEDDILQEADVYIVYGLHDQAEAELKKAIADQPQKLEYRQKLLENYLASNNQAAFDQHAEKLQSLEGNNKPEIWKKVQEMGLKISPDNSLYQNKKTADIDTVVFSEIDSPLETATVTKTKDTKTNKKVNNATSIEDASNTPKPSALTLIDTQFTAKAVKGSHSNPSTKQQSQIVDSDDFSLDDLEKELDAQAKNDNHHDASNIIDFETAFNDDNKDKDNADNKLALASLNLSVNSATGIDKILPKGTPYTNSSNSSQRNDMFSQEEDDILAFLDLPDENFDLHEAHISTKLELARAYLDMGDIEGARSTLEEVIVEGSDDQKREAEDLLHQTG